MHNIEILNLTKDMVGDTSSEPIETIGAVPTQTQVEDVPNWFVVLMGIGTVFVGLICIIILCKIVALFSKEKKTELKQEVAIARADEPIQNRGEIIAAVAAVCAEELGTDVSALRIHSFKKI